MNEKYQIGGSATLNGVIMINAVNGKVAWAVRSSDGAVSVKELQLFNKAMKIYKYRLERPLSKIPVIRELFKILLMLSIAISALITGIVQIFSSGKRWSFKRIAAILLITLSLYVFIFLNDYFTIAMLIILYICFNKEIKTMLKYHGAEHKCINLYENINDLSDLTADNAADYPRTHTRCGTNIIFLLILLSILLYFIPEQWFTFITAGSFLDFLGGLLLAGIAIELFKLFQKPMVQWVLKPGILLQRFVTTREPDQTQLEVALKALTTVLI